MADVRLRPRFRVALTCSPRAFCEAVADRLGSPEDGIHGTVFDRSAVLKVPAPERHTWSPQLHLSIDEDGSGGTVVHGLFGPHPTVWSLFIAAYTALAFLGSMGSIFGYSQHLLGQSSIWVWSIVWAMGSAAVVYGIARLGRSFGRNQTLELKGFVDEAVSACGAEAPVCREPLVP